MNGEFEQCLKCGHIWEHEDDRCLECGHEYTEAFDPKMKIKELQYELKKKWQPRQLCPKCQGQGFVRKPPWVPADVNEWSSSATSFVCDVCDGNKLI